MTHACSPHERIWIMRAVPSMITTELLLRCAFVTTGFPLDSHRQCIVGLRGSLSIKKDGKGNSSSSSGSSFPVYLNLASVRICRYWLYVGLIRRTRKSSYRCITRTFIIMMTSQQLREIVTWCITHSFLDSSYNEYIRFQRYKKN